MYLSQLRQITRAMCPGAKTGAIDSTIVDLMLNKGVDNIAAYTCCLKANKKFDAVASDGEYDLSSVIGDYLAVDKPGLWWYNGTQWRPVNPKTLKWLDENTPTWRNLSAGSPLNYSIDGDILTISPPPEDAGTEYFWLYYGKKPTYMSADGHYPFTGSTTELTHLRVFDIAICKFAKWMIEPMINKGQDANLSYQEFLAEREEAANLFDKRLDVMHSPEARFRT